MLNSNLGIPLLGAAIGNGWIDPKRQYATYIDFVVKVGLLEENSDVRVVCFDLVFNLTWCLTGVEGSKKAHG
jgi:carboxypeptidase C (cathepsin A)